MRYIQNEYVKMKRLYKMERGPMKKQPPYAVIILLVVAYEMFVIY